MEETTDGKLSRELEVVKKALARILQEENPLPLHQQQARDDELSRRISSHGSSSPSQALDSHDIAIISRLLHQVQLLEREDAGDLPTKAMSLEMAASCDGSVVANEKNVVETVAQIASAAAEVARAAAASSGKNLEVMESLQSSSEKSLPPQLTHSRSRDEEGKACNEDVSRQSVSDKDLVKKLERQNRITHCILGFMIVASAIWRFKIFSMFIGVRKSFTNPFQTFGEMVSEGFKGGNNKEEQSGAKGFHKARTVLPSILGGEEKEVSKRVEKTERSTTEDFKIGEALTLSLDNILSLGKPNQDSDKEESGKCD
ncbi:hypothetical protein GOP47_0021715 [Adiantum capillus-veneris]|uniref:Uncharacterized protein n=1 Tax=Adiantum capillus-veneris TaxID=13818 RepID=A0A9D4U8X6_ADICA|nr:hypothetical protein GOP47_0021715 [Adiantum capillus-veneris]